MKIFIFFLLAKHFVSYRSFSNPFRRSMSSGRDFQNKSVLT